METLLPIIDLFKKSFDVYVKKVWLLASTVLFSFLGFFVFLPFAITAFFISYKPFSNSNFDINIILFDILLALLGIFFAIILGLWSQTATLYAVKEGSITFKNLLTMAWPKIGSLFWVALLTALAVLGGFILFVIPGIIFSVWFCFSGFVFVAENLRGASALKKSRDLVKGYWWPVFGRLVVIGIVAGLISSIETFGPIINIFFMVPFATVFEYLLYQDLKRVKGI